MGRLERKLLSLENKFGIKYIVGSTLMPYNLIYRPINKVMYTGSFGIFSSALIKKYGGTLYDETYINGTEDIDLSWRVVQDHIKVSCIDYNIGDIVGGTIGPYNILRRLKGLLNIIYLNLKIETEELKFLANP